MNIVAASRPQSLRALIAAPEILIAPGVYDALTAHMANTAGFHAAYLSGASIAYTRFGRPDIGLVAMDEVAGTLSAICERVEIPLIVDADTGFGNALNVIRTVRLFERIGAAAIQIEDQVTPKRCGHLDDKQVVTTGEMVGKIKAALDARKSDDLLIIARTDAVAAEGFDRALDRAVRYHEAGADVLFVEALRSRDEIDRTMSVLGGRVPLMANMVEGGKTPLAAASDLQDMGYSLVIFPGGLVRALTHTVRAYFASLKTHGSNAPFRDRMLDFTELNDLLETESLLETGKRYDDPAGG